MAGRIEIDDVAPVVSNGRYPAKAVVGEVVPVKAAVWREGHDAVAATLVVRYHGNGYPRLAKAPVGAAVSHVEAVSIEEVIGASTKVRRQLLPMAQGRTPDVFHGQFIPDTVGLWTFRVDGWGDPLATWRKNVTAKLEAGQSESELDNDLLIGAALLERAATGVPRQDRFPLIDAAAKLREPGDPFTRAGAALATAVADLLHSYPLRELVTRGEQYGVWVDRPLARFSAWYEMFPRSTGGTDGKGNPVHGTFATACKALPRVAKMGFDIVYLPPIHPIGKVHRKGKNNSVTAAPKDVGSPWAIGSDKGGHDAVHPKLGTIDDFDDFVTAARDQGLEVALDLALQCAPDHPWAKTHPEWFTVLPDGTIAYAENPPKKYQDIYPVNFDNDPAGIYQEVLRVVLFWISHGVKVFRVDNPHTKPPNFWAWLIGETKNADPDVLFLAEAFTRPARLFGLAKLGFTQSYTYFTWRTAKWELQEFGESIAEHADYSRQSLWTNTPDILHESLQHGGPGMFAIRAVMAATMSSTWGVYSGYELFEHQAVRAGSEEYLDSEKYQLRPRDFEEALSSGQSLEPFLARLNEIRRLHPALSQLRTIKFHHLDNDALLAYSKFDPITGDCVLVVVTLNAFGPEESTLWLDMGALGLEPYDRFWVRDEVTGDEYQWGQSNYVRIDPVRAVAHVLNMPQISPEKRLQLLREGITMTRTNPITSTHLRPGDADLGRLLAGEHHDPHSVLGAHEYGDHTVIRVLRPNALEVVALIGGERYPFTHVEDALFAVAVPFTNLVDYRLEISYPGGDSPVVTKVADPYRFLPTLGEVDLHLFSEGRHERLWEVLGAHPRTYDTPDGPVDGVSFAVWAPNAKGVSLIGEFNHWSGIDAPLRTLGATGVWELFWPGFPTDGLYKFRVHGADGVTTERADPMAFAAEVPPQRASRVTRSDYTWGDDDWMAQRTLRNPVFEPMSTYEVHLMSWRPGLSYRQLATELTDYVVEQGFTHVELLPVAEHPFGGSWGYQVTSYYAPTSRLGTPDDFRFLVDALHRAGIGVIVDWVPAHFPKDAWALGRFDGTPLYEHSDPRRGEQLDWGTYVFDFGRPEVRNFLVANALYWLQEFHIDGLRVDAVASMLYLDYSRPVDGWTPNIHGGRENLEAVQFLQEMNATVHKIAPGIVTIAEESTSWPGVTRPTNLGGLGFSMKWNMGWMNDTLAFISRDPIHRSYHHHEMTFSLLYAFSENFVLPISHDEVVHGKGTLWGRMPGNDHMKAAGVRGLLAYQWAHPGKQLLFMGQEFGQRAEWSEERGLDWFQLGEHGFSGGLQRFVGDINDVYRTRRALWSRDSSPEGYSWIDANDSANNVLSFLRFGDDGSMMACVFNFSGSEHSQYRLGLPHAGTWREVLNTDSDVYNGSGIGNFGAVEALDEPWHGRPASATMVLPPLAALWFEPA